MKIIGTRLVSDVPKPLRGKGSSVHVESVRAIKHNLDKQPGQAVEFIEDDAKKANLLFVHIRKMHQKIACRKVGNRLFFWYKEG
jgi:hypothetical protein